MPVADDGTDALRTFIPGADGCASRGITGGCALVAGSVAAGCDPLSAGVAVAAAFGADGALTANSVIVPALTWFATAGLVRPRRK